MVDRRVGRTERPELGHGRAEPRRAPETQDGDVRQPRALLALVDAEGLESVEETAGQVTALACRVVEDEHRDAAGLAIAAWREQDLAGVPCRRSERGRNRREFDGGPMAEEGERDVEMLAGDDPAVAEMLGLPGLDPVDDVVGEAKAAKEAKALIGVDASR
jgi:hypothetical protein